MEASKIQSAEQKNNVNNNENVQNGGLLSSVFNLIFWIALISMYLWNWDGFWQTDIKVLTQFQKNYFSNKYNEEQLKISRIANNNQLVLDMEERANRYQRRADAAERKEQSAKTALDIYRNQQNERCEYYKTSLRIINNITRSISADDINQLIRCTNKECEDIINNAPKATEVCN